VIWNRVVTPGPALGKFELEADTPGCASDSVVVFIVTLTAPKFNTITSVLGWDCFRNYMSGSAQTFESSDDGHGVGSDCRFNFAPLGKQFTMTTRVSFLIHDTTLTPLTPLQRFFEIILTPV
jgi:hypothetical protein